MTDNTAGLTNVRLLTPDGTQVTTSTSAGVNFDLAAQTLPVSGNYTIVVNPEGANAGSIKAAVTNP